jgi:rSAM/selenodomain-associated transferase 2
VSNPAISVVIPALNERATLEDALGSTQAPGVERIVVDGGSTDGTVEAARALGAECVLVSAPGRAVQMNAGYGVASGEVILFLHADTALESGWDTEVRRALVDPRVSGGVFELRFASPRRVYRWIERGARLRARLARLPYGDQGIFVRRKVLDDLGGLPATPIFEDLDLVRAVRRAGRLAFLPVRAYTSARRYDRNGPIRTMGRHALVLGGYLLGLDRARVARWHRSRPER